MKKKAKKKAMKSPAPAGYSGTPLPKKLGIREGSRAVLLGAPAGFEGVLGPLSDGALLSRRASKAADLVLWFPRNARELGTRLAGIVDGLEGGLWIAWPKQASGVPTDLT